MREAIGRRRISDEDVGDVILGCVLQAGQGMNVARQAAIKAGLPHSVPGETVNRVCGSGLTAVVHAVEGVKAGFVDVIVAGGTESMSNAPYLLKGARWGYRMGHSEVLDSMIAEGLTCAIEGCHMGNTAEAIAVKYGVGREEQDRFAAESQARAERAGNDGRFADEIVPVEIPQRKGAPVRVDRDEYPRAGTTVEKLAALKAAFQTKDGTVTAGNASGINDGAAALVVATESWARERGKTPLARVLAYATVGVEPKYMGMGPVPAITTALARARAARRPDRRLRAERGIRRTVPRRRPRAWPRSAARERARWRHCARPSHWRQRRARVDDAALRAAASPGPLWCRVPLHRRRNGRRDGRRSGIWAGLQRCRAHATERQRWTAGDIHSRTRR